MSAYLLDTHAALWWWTDAPQLGQAARAIIEDRRTQLFVSAVSALEIGLKWRMGKLPHLGDPRDSYRPLVARNGFVDLPITDAHAIMAGCMAGDHRDPFDRLIAAQALIEDLQVVTRDPQIAAFGCKVVW